MTKAQKEGARVAAGMRHAIAEWRVACDLATIASKDLRRRATEKRHAERVLNMAVADAEAIGIRRLDLTGGKR